MTLETPFSAEQQSTGTSSPPPGSDGRGDGMDARDVRGTSDPEQPADLHVSRIKVQASRLQLPKLDDKLVENCAHLEDCEVRVAAHHRSLFHSWYAGETERAVQSRDLLNRHIERLQGWIARLSRRIARTDELLRREQEAKGTTPWSTGDRVLAAGFGLFSLVLLGMGMNTLATYLMDSGFILFVEHPALAYLLSAVNLGMAVLLKVGASWCRDDVARHRYFLWLWGLGLLSGAVWLVAFATIFPNIETRGVDEVIASLSKENGIKQAILEGTFVCSQLVCEICISAALWMHLERMVRAHAPSSIMERNPEHRAYVDRLSGYNEHLRVAVEKRAALDGRLKEIAALESAYLSMATSAAKARAAALKAARYGMDRNGRRRNSASTT